MTKIMFWHDRKAKKCFELAGSGKKGLLIMFVPYLDLHLAISRLPVLSPLN